MVTLSYADMLSCHLHCHVKAMLSQRGLQLQYASQGPTGLSVVEPHALMNHIQQQPVHIAAAAVAAHVPIQATKPKLQQTIQQVHHTCTCMCTL